MPPENPETPGVSRPPNAPAIGSRRPKKKKVRVRQRTRITCLVCHEEFPSITPEHLQTHGLTVARYRRTFLGGASAVLPASAVDPMLARPGPVSNRIAERLVGDPNFITTLADEVSEAIFAGPMRGQLRAALCSVLGSRMKMHGEAVAALNKLRAEIMKPWRVEQGGELGAPTETRELVSMAMQMHAEVGRTEDALLKTIKLAIDESKGRDRATSDRGGLPVYTGDAEVIPIPTDISADEREVVRSLLSMLTNAPRAPGMKTITATVLPTPPPAATPPAGESMQSVLQELARDLAVPTPPMTNDPPFDPLAM